MKKYVDIALEKDFLRHILRSTSKLQKSHGEFPAEAFSSSVLRKIYGVILDHYEGYGNLVSLKELQYLLGKLEYASDEEAENARVLASSLFVEEDPEHEFPFLYDELLRLRRARKLLNTLSDVGKLLEKGKLEDSEKLVSSYVEDPSLRKEETVKEYELIDSAEEILKEIEEQAKNPKKFRGIPCAIPEFDDFSQGLFKGELGIVGYNCSPF